MAKLIKSDIIIGNAIIKAEDGITTVEEIEMFEKEISNLIKMNGYYTNFSNDKICSFCEEYPYFAQISFNGVVTRNTDEKTLERMKQYFVMGLPLEIQEAMNIVTNIDNDNAFIDDRIYEDDESSSLKVYDGCFDFDNQQNVKKYKFLPGKPIRSSKTYLKELGMKGFHTHETDD